jgi:hypothetical protein
MKAKRALSGLGFARLERRDWAENHLLATNASAQFQKFADETFRKLRRRYFSPADLLAEMNNAAKNKESKRWRVPLKSHAS